MQGSLIKTKYSVWLLGSFLTLFGGFLRVDVLVNTQVIKPVRADAVDYFWYAYNINQHGIYSKSPEDLKTPDNIRPPAMPFVASFFLNTNPLKYSEALTADHAEQMIKPFLFMQMLISVLLIPILFFALKKIANISIAFLATFLHVISPHLINANIYFLTESLNASIFVVLICCIIFSLKQKTYSAFFGIGLTLAAASLLKASAMLVFVPLSCAYIYSSSKQTRKKMFKLLLATYSIFAVLYGAWLFRNATIVGDTVSKTLSTNFLHHGIYPNMKYQEEEVSYGFPYRFDPRANEINESKSTVLQEIKRRFSEEPAKHIEWYLLGKPLLFWSWEIIAGMGDSFIYPVKNSPYFDQEILKLTHFLAYYSHNICLFLALLAVITCLFKPCNYLLNKELSQLQILLAAIVAYYTLIHMVGAPFPRYSIPLRPLIYTLGAIQCFNIFLNIKTLAAKLRGENFAK
ncbi:MAG: hypothetical protein AAGB12_02605 [Pseudomonadota bacterium]